MIENLDTLEEKREMVAMLADYQQNLAQGYNRKVRPWGFVTGDLFCKKLWEKYQNVGKLALNWEGPYRVKATAGIGAYYLEDMEERPLPDHGMSVI